MYSPHGSLFQTTIRKIILEHAVHPQFLSNSVHRREFAELYQSSSAVLGVFFCRQTFQAKCIWMKRHTLWLNGMSIE